MQRQLTSLVAYDATSKQKAFTVQYKEGSSSNAPIKTVVYVGNVEKNDNVFDPAVDANRFCLSSASFGIVHNLYDSAHVLFHGLAARRHRYLYSKTDDYQHIYRALYDHSLSTYIDNPLCCVTKVQDTLYGLDSPGIYGHCYVNDEMYSWLAQDNGYPFPKPIEYSTLLYDNRHLSAASTVKIIKSQALSVTYNTLFEVPGNIYTDYSKGSMFATTAKCKTQYNAYYSMASADTGDHGKFLANARCYTAINSCNNQLYLQFDDTRTFDSKQLQDSLTAYVDGEEHTISMLSACEGPSCTRSSCIDQIEMIENINRGASPSNHKSSLYSLRLSAPDLEKLDVPVQAADENDNAYQLRVQRTERIRENVRQEVKNMIRQLAERVAPANTQLFSVTVNSK